MIHPVLAPARQADQLGRHLQPGAGQMAAVAATHQTGRRSVGRPRADHDPAAVRNGASPRFVSVLADNEMPIEQSQLAGHRGGAAVTDRVYRQQIRPVITDGAEAMDAICGPPPDDQAEDLRAGTSESETGIPPPWSAPTSSHDVKTT